MPQNYLKNKNRFEVREPLRSFLTSLKNICNADACSLYLINEDMDEQEKKEEFRKKFPDGVILENDKLITEENIDSYCVLKFIGVDDTYDGENGDYSHFWEYDYKNRPNKYIVFRDHKAIPTIKGEGITGLTARKQELRYYSNSQIYSCNSRSDTGDTERKIHPSCQELITIPVLDNGITRGVIRLDIYNIHGREQKKFFTRIKDKDFSEDCSDFIQFGITSNTYLLINELCKQVVEISNRDSKENSYKKLFHGDKIIESIKNIETYVGESGFESNKKIYELIKHLFFVFQRHTYIGYDEIMKRVMYFIADVFDHLNMKEYYKSTEGKLLNFRDHEELMLYSIEKYRDHFMHQFHVFILGYIIINYIGVDRIKNAINARIKNTSNYNNVEVDEESVMRMWVLIAFFHDIAYIFQKYDSTMQKFISEQLFTEIPIHIDWGNILSGKNSKTNYIDTLSKISAFFESPQGPDRTNKIELFKNYIQALQDSQDHGLLSSILLVNLFMPIIDQEYNSNYHESNKRTVEIYLSALAISLHNECAFNALKESPDRNTISFESFPLEFLLMYCDTAQEWGRKKEVNKVFYDAPVLSRIEFGDGEKSINCNLKYLSAKYPEEKKLQSFFAEKISKFYSDSVVFKISYSYETGKTSNQFSFSSVRQ